MSKFTPGPWKAKRTGYWSNVYADYVDEPIASNCPPEDAHLIAAAPELYEAVETFLTQWEFERIISLRAVAEMQAALAKARGEKP